MKLSCFRAIAMIYIMSKNILNTYMSSDFFIKTACLFLGLHVCFLWKFTIKVNHQTTFLLLTQIEYYKKYLMTITKSDVNHTVHYRLLGMLRNQVGLKSNSLFICNTRITYNIVILHQKQ